MENSIDQENNYQYAKEKAKRFYANIKKVWSPALNDYVTFNSDGFRHIVWQKKTPRRRKEQLRRFGLLSHAADIVSNPDKEFEYRKRKHPMRVEDVQFWGFTKNIEGKQLEVVVRQVGNGHKHFLSIFEKKQKTARE